MHTFWKRNSGKEQQVVSGNTIQGYLHVDHAHCSNDFAKCCNALGCFLSVNFLALNYLSVSLLRLFYYSYAKYVTNSNKSTSNSYSRHATTSDQVLLQYLYHEPNFELYFESTHREKYVQIP